MKVVAVNKPARFHYEIIETVEAGIVLQGSEVKSIREGRISLKDAYADIQRGEVVLLNCHISPYEAANRFNHEPERTRKLLLHRREVKRLTGKVQERGLTLVPMKVVLNDRGFVKVELALAKGKKVYEKKEALKERDLAREARAALKYARR
ncbi:MAG: SsrA-binding protein SmpB [Candidatus Aminicenantes bacterium]|nr:SsrA-binding protein SmpB [Candidatus Aminicenantes bacterium]